MNQNYVKSNVIELSVVVGGQIIVFTVVILSGDTLNYRGCTQHVESNPFTLSFGLFGNGGPPSEAEYMKRGD